MAKQDRPDDLNKAVESANAEANQVFGRLATVLEKASKRGTSLKVLEVTREAGLEIDERTLASLRIDPIIYIHPWLPWHVWFPWRPLWCWWWHSRWPWYHSCPWWWYRCYWHPHC